MKKYIKTFEELNSNKDENNDVFYA